MVGTMLRCSTDGRMQSNCSLGKNNASVSIVCKIILWHPVNILEKYLLSHVNINRLIMNRVNILLSCFSSKEIGLL